MQTLRLFIRLSRPFFLLGAALVYALGVGIAHYLGVTVDWGMYFLGQAWVTLLQLATHYLNEYFDSPQDLENTNRTPFSGGSGALGPGKLPRATALAAGAACLTVVASLTVLLIQRGLTPTTLFIMSLAFIGAVFYSVPPVRLSSSGYGELTTSILVANLVPAFAFLLQTGELHRLLAMATFPLTPLHISMMMAFELPDYAADFKREKRTLMVRMGWQRGMLLHNLLILSAYLLLAVALGLGLPIPIGLPTFLPFPLGVLQIWQMRRIADGIRPNWTALTLTSIVLFATTAYLLTFAFWTR
jgi:1,4-dihydroxy-2-naphthoate octaprenyltransferase